MTWEPDALCEVRVAGQWVAGVVISEAPQLRVKTLGGDLVRPMAGAIRAPKTASSLRHAVPPPSSEVAEVEALESILEHAGFDVRRRVPETVVKQVAKAVELRRVPKPEKPWRSSKHLAHVRSLPCCVCGHGPQSEAHHVGPHPMGRKVSDAQTAPLCGIDHTEFHLTGRHDGGSRAVTMALQWTGVMMAARSSLESMGLSADDVAELRAEAAEAAAMVWCRALEGRDAAEESET